LIICPSSYSASRIDRRSQAVEQDRVDRDSRHGIFQLLPADGFAGNRLRLDGDHVVGQRHGRRAHVSIGGNGGLRLLATLLGQREVIIVERGRAGMHDDLPRAQRCKHAVQDAERQGHAFGNVATAGGPGNQQVLENQRLDERQA
jgi:hypothetical protein